MRSPEPWCLVDGAGITGAEDLCRHGTAWYAHRLGTTLLARLSLAGAGEYLPGPGRRARSRHR